MPRPPLRAPLLVVVVLLLAGVAAVAIARSGDPAGSAPVPAATGPSAPAPAPSPRDEPLPAPDAALPRTEAGSAEALTRTTRRVRRAVEAWSDAGSIAPPRAVTLLTLYQQRLYRRLATDPERADRVVARLGPGVRGEARDIVLAGRALGRIPRSGPAPAVRTARAVPAAQLRRAYARGERRFGVPRDVLAAVNFVESAFGRIRSASEAGARGPMQFLPATWRQYGLGGDIDDPGDAILGAANYLAASGAPGNLRRALFAYNRSTDYVSAILRYARRMERDPRTFLALYSWQAYVRTSSGATRRVTGPV